MATTAPPSETGTAAKRQGGTEYVSGARSATSKADAARGTEYVVLLAKGGDWAEAGRVHAASAEQAARLVFEKLNAPKPDGAASVATLVAVPARSFQPVSAKLVPRKPRVEIG